VIKDNIFQNCKKTIVRRTDKPLEPIDSEIQGGVPRAITPTEEIPKLEEREAEEELAYEEQERGLMEEKEV
jgi:hypothetical protein